MKRVSLSVPVCVDVCDAGQGSVRSTGMAIGDVCSCREHEYHRYCRSTVMLSFTFDWCPLDLFGFILSLSKWKLFQQCGHCVCVFEEQGILGKPYQCSWCTIWWKKSCYTKNRIRHSSQNAPHTFLLSIPVTIYVCASLPSTYVLSCKCVFLSCVCCERQDTNHWELKSKAFDLMLQWQALTTATLAHLNIKCFSVCFVSDYQQISPAAFCTL